MLRDLLGVLSVAFPLGMRDDDDDDDDDGGGEGCILIRRLPLMTSWEFGATDFTFNGFCLTLLPCMFCLSSLFS